VKFEVIAMEFPVAVGKFFKVVLSRLAYLFTTYFAKFTSHVSDLRESSPVRQRNNQGSPTCFGK
jgi:hypothetical protein